jgi:hypothetical protein
VVREARLELQLEINLVPLETTQFLAQLLLLEVVAGLPTLE